MKKTKIKKVVLIFTVLLVIVIGAIYILNSIMTSPKSRLKQQFNIDLSGKEFTISNEKELWYPNGDGYYYVEITLDRNENIVKDLIDKKFKSLPIVEDIPIIIVPNGFDAKSISKGYYKFGSLDPADDGDFKLAIYDIKTNKIIFYYQLM